MAYFDKREDMFLPVIFDPSPACQRCEIYNKTIAATVDFTTRRAIQLHGEGRTLPLDESACDFDMPISDAERALCATLEAVFDQNCSDCCAGDCGAERRRFVDEDEEQSIILVGMMPINAAK